MVAMTRGRICGVQDMLTTFIVYGILWLGFKSVSTAAQTTAEYNASSVCFELSASPNLTKYVDALPILPTIDLTNGSGLTLGTYAILQKLHRDLNETQLYAYGTSSDTAMYPGPTLMATMDVPVTILWENHIEGDHIFTVDRSLDWANPENGGVPIVTHLHGMECDSASDGHPNAWITSTGETGPKWVTQNYTYPNSLRPSLLWYHDHTVGITRLNVAAGLAGAYIVQGDNATEQALNLPSGEFDIVLILQTSNFSPTAPSIFRMLDNSQMFTPTGALNMWGTLLLLTGRFWPYLNVSARKYRLRFVNGANSRTLVLSFNSSGLNFTRIGTDGGFLDAPIQQREVRISPAERADLIVDFSILQPNTDVILNNTGPVPFPYGTPDIGAIQVLPVMQFRVVEDVRTDNSSIPEVLRDPVEVSVSDVSVIRQLTLLEIDQGGIATSLLLDNRTWNSPATELPRENATEIWEIVNAATNGVGHPIHIHLVRFQILNQQSYNVTSFLNKTCVLNNSSDVNTNSSCYIGPVRPPDDDSLGWKDTAMAWPGNVTRFLIRFTSQDGGPFPFDPTTEPGYMWHCHLLDHEDNIMMRPMLIQK